MDLGPSFQPYVALIMMIVCKVHKVPINSGQVLTFHLLHRADEDGTRKKLPPEETIIKSVFITSTLSLAGQVLKMLQKLKKKKFSSLLVDILDLFCE